MIIKVKDSKGNVAIVDNEGEVNGEVRVTGDDSLVSHLDLIINVHTSIASQGMFSTIDEKFILREEGKLPEIYKASNDYLREYFIPVECPLFNYTAEILEE